MLCINTFACFSDVDLVLIVPGLEPQDVVASLRLLSYKIRSTNFVKVRANAKVKINKI